MFFFLLESRPDLTNEYQTASTVNPNPPPTLSPHLPVQAPPICSTPPARLGRAAYPPPSGFPTGLVTGWSLVFWPLSGATLSSLIPLATSASAPGMH